jgi:phospholipase/carboxylesterase
VGLAVPTASLGNWLTRALAANVPFEGPSREFGEPVLRLKDPDGMIVRLVGANLATSAPLPDAPTRLRCVTLLTDKGEATAEFVTRFGYRHAQLDGLTQRMMSDTDVVDVREVAGSVPSVPGARVPDHAAFRAPDADAVRSMLIVPGSWTDRIHDRRYFLSLYVRDPAGILIEHATDGPGMTVDEALHALGQTLFLPPHEAGRAEELKAMLPQFALPGEERLPARHLPFVHRFNRPPHPDGSSLALLHGTGGNEADLMPIARRIAPHATLLGVRGRATEDGTNGWFRRMGAAMVDPADLRGETEAFAAFVEGAVTGYGLEADRLVFLGYSNGASFLAAFIALHPGIVRRAILLRGIRAFEGAGAGAITGTRVLVLDGRDDPVVRSTSTLTDDLRARGASVEARSLPAGHDLTGAEVTESARWLRQNLPGEATSRRTDTAT